MTLSHQVRAPHDSQASEFLPIQQSVLPWRLVEWIGAGATTNVYRARHADQLPGSPADYALKILRSDWPDLSVARELLVKEACVGRSVSHPHLIAVLTRQLAATPYFLAMPYLAGTTASGLLANQQRLPTLDVLWIARQAGEALGALHAAGWIHGDVKPTNLMVAPNGHVTVFDLGFARRIGEESPLHVCGSPAYTPPELSLPRTFNQSAIDQYGLGITMFELLTGTRPFSESNPKDLALAHRHLPVPDPRRWVPSLDHATVQLLKRLLSKEPQRRPTAEELVATLVALELDHLEEHQGTLPSRKDAAPPANERQRTANRR